VVKSLVQTLCLTPAEARRFLIRSFALESYQSLGSVQDALNQLEYIQEDSIDVCGRMHELILWPRVKNYAPEKLHRALYGIEAHAFEHYLPNLSALPLADYPHFRLRMQERAKKTGRWGGLLDEEKPVAERFLQALDESGPLKTRSVGSADGHMRSGWGSRATVVSQVVEKLWLTGTLAIARRDGFERVFDRTERVHPSVLSTPIPDPTESARYLTQKRLRAKALFRPKRDEVKLLGEDAFTKIEIMGLSKPWYCLSAPDPDSAPRPPVLGGNSGEDIFLLAPLDPVIYDRQRNRELFDFDYTWEVYVPEAKRKWGYYVLPILQGDKIIGRLEPKIDRKNQILNIRSLNFEDGKPNSKLRKQVQARIEEMALFLGAMRVDFL
jgi:uncharacterized protein